MADFIWSEHWYLDENEAWFVGGSIKALFKADLIKNECHLIAIIPESDIYCSRSYPGCLKVGDKIFCLPYEGDVIWTYDLICNVWKEIMISNPQKKEIGIWNFWRDGELLWCIAKGLKQIIKVNLKNESIEGYWDITANHEEKFGNAILVGEKIYIVSASAPRVYIFNLRSFQVSMHVIPDIEDKLFAIAYDGEKFWLSGYKRMIYVWNEQYDTVKTLVDFPERFGTYSRIDMVEKFWDENMIAFFDSICIEDNVFFLPLRVNQIIYFNKNTLKANVLEIENEDETPEELQSGRRAFGDKYTLAYIRKCFIGIYSLRNKIVFEIDTRDMKIQYKRFFIEERDKNLVEEREILNCIKAIEENGIYDNSSSDVWRQIGKSIHENIIKD